MKTYDTITERKPVERKVLTSLTCDCCGKTDTGDHVELMSDIEPLDISFGYGSTRDMERYKIDVCTDCVINWFSTFKHNPTELPY